MAAIHDSIKPTPDHAPPPKPAPRWMSWVVATCFFVTLLVGLAIDGNGNMTVDPSGYLPDVLDPAPIRLLFLAFAGGTIISIVHAVLYRSRRYLWIGISLLWAIYTIVGTLPAW